MKRRSLLFFLATLTAAPLVQAQGLEILQLRHRPADQLIPIVRPLLDQGGAVTGTGFQLIVRTSPANLAQIRQVVASLDRAARQLIITVRQDADTRDSRSAAGANIVLAPGASRATGTIVDSAAQGRDNLSQQIRTQEGVPAQIQTGSSQMLRNQTVTRTVNGVVVQESYTPRDIVSGFFVTPRINGDAVTLDISTRREIPADLGPGSANTNRTVSSITGRLGEWIEVGGVNQSRASEGSGILSRSSEAGSLDRRVFLRVEEVK